MYVKYNSEKCDATSGGATSNMIEAVLARGAVYRIVTVKIVRYSNGT